MIVLQVSGTRYATDANRDQIAAALRPYGQDYSEPITLRHGAARGVDTMAADIAATCGWLLDPYPARWRECGAGCPPRPHLNDFGSCPYAGNRRNRIMLTTDPRPNIIVTFPAIGSGATGKGGTWDFMKQACDLGFEVDRMVPLAVEIPGRAATLPGLETARSAA